MRVKLALISANLYFRKHFRKKIMCVRTYTEKEKNMCQGRLEMYFCGLSFGTKKTSLVCAWCE